MTLTFAQWAFILPVGVFFSTLGTLVGLGGGVFMVPLLVLLFAVPLKTAIAAVTFCLFPAALLSTLFNARQRHIDYFAGITLEIPAIVGTILGALLTTVLPVKPMELMFALFVALMGWRILFGKKSSSGPSLMERLNQVPPVLERSHYRAGLPAMGFFGLSAGLMAGMFGVGGGIIKTPVMLKVFRMPARKATATALFTIIFTIFTKRFPIYSMLKQEAVTLVLNCHWQSQEEKEEND